MEVKEGKNQNIRSLVEGLKKDVSKIEIEIPEKKISMNEVRNMINSTKNSSTSSSRCRVFRNLINFMDVNNLIIQEGGLILPPSQVSLAEMVLEIPKAKNKNIIILPNLEVFQKLNKKKLHALLLQHCGHLLDDKGKKVINPSFHSFRVKDRKADLYNTMISTFKEEEKGASWDIGKPLTKDLNADPDKQRQIFGLNDHDLQTLLCLFVYSFKFKKWIRSSCKTNYICLAGIFKDREIYSNKKFKYLRETIDAVMKIKYSQEKNPHNRLRDAFTKSQIAKALKSRYCSIDTPLGLLCRILFIFGIGFGLRIGELLNSEFIDYQVQKFGGKSYLSYYPNAKRTKTISGGFNDDAMPPIKYLGEISGSLSCPVYLFNLLEKHVPPGATRIFNKCLEGDLIGDQWYSNEPDEAKMRKMIPMIAKKLEFQGNFKNHSLRITCASLLHQSNISYKRIQQVTGHKSNALDVYLRDNPVMMQEISDILLPLAEENDPLGATKEQPKIQKNKRKIAQEAPSQNSQSSQKKRDFKNLNIETPSWYQGKQNQNIVDQQLSSDLFKNMQILGGTVNIHVHFNK